MQIIFAAKKLVLDQCVFGELSGLVASQGHDI